MYNYRESYVCRDNSTKEFNQQTFNPHEQQSSQSIESTLIQLNPSFPYPLTNMSKSFTTNLC